MMATQADIEAVRDWVGSNPDDPTISLFLARPLTVNGAALAILKRRQQDLVNTRVERDVPDDGTIRFDRISDMKALSTAIAQLENLVAAESSTGDPEGLPVVSVGSLHRRVPIR